VFFFGVKINQIVTKIHAQYIKKEALMQKKKPKNVMVLGNYS
jgi:hypothetical protein